MPLAADEDDSQPFALTIITAILVPWALKKLYGAISASPSEPAKWIGLGFSSTAPVVRKEVRLAGSWPHWLSWQNALFGILLAVDAFLFQEAMAEPPVVPPFDPYEVLELDASVEGCSRRMTQWGEVKCSQATIRAAYRKMARHFHPDKTTDDVEVAKARFDAVVKAHAVLTSPVAARNYAKYGNPDGYQGFKFGIALPAWAMTERAFLACFLVVVVIVPLLFCIAHRMQTLQLPQS